MTGMASQGQAVESYGSGYTRPSPGSSYPRSPHYASWMSLPVRPGAPSIPSAGRRGSTASGKRCSLHSSGSDQHTSRRQDSFTRCSHATSSVPDTPALCPFRRPGARVVTAVLPPPRCAQPATSAGTDSTLKSGLGACPCRICSSAPSTSTAADPFVTARRHAPLTPMK